MAHCPICDDVGALGAPCSSRGCTARGIHFVPDADAAAFKATPATQAEPLVGTFVGEYLVLARLGRGGFGRVLLGLQRPHFKLRAAIKLLETDGVEASLRRGMLDKFDNEAQALAVLRHPNIVSLLRFGRLAGEPFLAMEFVPGARTLSSVIAAHQTGGGRAFEPVIVRRLVDQLLRGLEVAHRAGIIHRDLKPDNLMLEEIDGDPWHLKIVDFGLAKDYRVRQETSVVVGTLAYMAPEQLACRALGPWTDLYAVAVIAFELMTGRYLFEGSQLEMMRQKSEPFARADVAEALASLPAGWQTFFAGALAPEPKRRFQTVAELRAAFVAATTARAHEATTTPSLGAAASMPGARRRRWVAGVAGVAVASTAVGIALALVATSGATSSASRIVSGGRILDATEPPSAPKLVVAAPVATPVTAAPVTATVTATPVATPGAAPTQGLRESEIAANPAHAPAPKPGSARVATPSEGVRSRPAGTSLTAAAEPLPEPLVDDLPVLRKQDAADPMTVKKKDAVHP